MSTRALRQTNNESRVIESQKKTRKDLIQSLKVTGNESGRSQGGSGGESPDGGSPVVTAPTTKVTDLGTFSGAKVIDFQIYDDRNLTGNVDGDTQITFINIPFLLLLSLRLYIRSVDPIITIAGTIISGVGSSPLITTAIGDFLDISLASDDQITIQILSVKKNDETEGPGAVAPDPPQNVNAIGNSPDTINVIWDPPLIGSLPITYDVAFSTSSAGDPATGPTTHAPGSPDLDITTNLHTITGLVAATTYYVWIRAKNAIGNSDYVGPFQTNTDGTTNPGGVNFAIPGVTVLYNSITVTWDQPGALRFTLIRTNTITGEIEILQNFKTFDADIVDNVGIEPNTNYDYKLTTFNEFGAILGSQIINVTSDSLPTPSTVLSLSGGVKLQFAVTFPANISLAKIEFATDALFTQNIVLRDFSRPLGDWTIQSVETFISNGLVKSTQYFGRVKFVKNGVAGPFGNTAPTDVTTSNVNPPAKPGIVMSSPATGEVRIKLDFNDGVSTAEWIVVSYRISTEVGPYTPFETYFRDDPPLDDLDSSEDEIEIIRDGFTPGETFTFRAEAFNQSGASLGGADTDNVLVDT